jgi:hypothetical protein
MATFFHISRTSAGRAIVASSDARARLPDIFFSPRVPEDHADEPTEPRICVAPNVWQCLASSPQLAEQQFIYRLDCSGAKRAGKEVGDAHVTQEHWITDNVVSQNCAELSLVLVGVINNACGVRTQIQSWLERQRDAAVDPTGFDELKQIWTVDTATTPMEWRLRDELIPESTDDSPLPPPPSMFPTSSA